MGESNYCAESCLVIELNERKIKADDAVLLILLSLPDAGYIQSERQVLFTDRADNSRIYFRVELDSKQERILTAQSTDSTPSDFHNRLREQIEGVASTSRSTIFRPMLCGRSISGFIQIADHFSIFPAHLWANVVDVDPFRHTRSLSVSGELDGSKFGPPFPVILEVTVDVSKDHPLYLSRGIAELDRYQNLTSLLIRDLRPFHISGSHRNWSTFGDIREGNLQITHGLATPGFSFDGDGTLDRFISDGGTALSSYSGETSYYDALFFDLPFQVPFDLDEMISAHESLDPERAASFDRACFLFTQAEFLRSHGFDHLVSYTSAIECLISREFTKCESCGQSKFGVRQKFNKFMETFAPTSDAVIASRKKMYDSRSKSAHGVRIAKVENRSSLFGSREHDDVLFPWLIRKALVNWLVQEGKKA